MMKLIKTGKTKDVYKLPCGNYLLKFKDEVTGLPSGEADPGGNKVVGTMAGVAFGALKMSAYYFGLLEKHNIFTHYLSADMPKNEMIVRPAVTFGSGLEFILRYKAAGSFVRRFGNHCKEGDALPRIFEVCMKDDERDDPPASAEILIALKILTAELYKKIQNETITICDFVKDDLEARGLELIDIKVEFGLIEGKIALIDEIGPGNMRVYKDGKKLDYLSLSNFITV